MQQKASFKKRAIGLRKQGQTYSEILKTVPVAKSTLSLWLGEVGLTKKQKQQITEKRLIAARRGGAARRTQRLQNTRKIQEQAFAEVGSLTKRELWLLGAALYWAEGTKEKIWRPGTGVEFANADTQMILFFIHWLVQICDIDPKTIRLNLYIHENQKSRIEDVKQFWYRETGYVPSYVYFKKHNPKTKRQNISEQYHGLIAVRVPASSTLNRKISGWILGIVGNYKTFM